MGYPHLDHSQAPHRPTQAERKIQHKKFYSFRRGGTPLRAWHGGVWAIVRGVSKNRQVDWLSSFATSANRRLPGSGAH